MFEKYTELVDKYLADVLKPDTTEYAVLKEAMYYSASAGGKRIRPSLLLEFNRICGGDYQKALPFAVALEMIHTYSLIHDDLPCMDNDDMRRGKPSCHIAFGEATALLAGDALLTNAFKVALSTNTEQAERVVKAAAVLAEYAGVDGMIGGQVIDLKYETESAPLEAVKEMYRLKTGALLVAAAKIGCILAGADDEKLRSAAEFAEKLGLAFQIKDDILDVISTTEQLGKPVGSDEQSSKSTYVTYKGLDIAQADVEAFTAEAVYALAVFGDEANELKKFAIELIDRKH